jgi:hypothetical protein
MHHLVTIALILLSWSFNFQKIGTTVLYVHDASDITIDLLKMFNYLKLEVSRSSLKHARQQAERCALAGDAIRAGSGRHAPRPCTSTEGLQQLSIVRRALQTHASPHAAHRPRDPRASKSAHLARRSSPAVGASQGPSGLFAVEVTFVLNLVSWVWWRVYQLPFRIVRASVMDGFVNLYEPVCSSRPLYVICQCYAFVWLLLALCMMHVWWLYLLLRIAYKLVASPSNAHDATRDEYEGDSDDQGDKED